MGCKASKQNQSLQPIECSFTPTTRADLDEFFVRACQLLQKIETLRYQIYTTKQQGTLLAGTSHMVDSPYTRAVQVLFWALSASKQGNIAQTGLTVSRQAPFISVSLEGVCKETIELLRTLKEYLVILTETPASLQNLVTQVQHIKDEQTEIKKNLEPKLPAKVARTVDENMRKLTEGIATSAKILNQAPDEQVNALQIISYMESIVKTSDDIGLKASAARLVKPIEISKWVELENKKNDKSRGTSVDKNKKAKGNDSKNNNMEMTTGAVPNQGMNPIVNPNEIVFKDQAYNGQKFDLTNKLHEVQPGAKGQVDSLSFGEGKNVSVYSQYHASQTTPVEIISENKLEKHEMEKSRLERQKWLQENQSIEAGMSLNNSHTQASFLQQAGQDDKLLKKNNTVGAGAGAPKGHFYVREKEFEVVIRDQPIKVERTKSPGYLSPGGSKQAGILQGEENILDDQEMIHGLANESTMIKKFIEKAQGYLEMKD